MAISESYLNKRENKNRNYFVSKPSVVLRENKDGSGKINHLLLGDWLRYKGETHLHKWTTSKGKKKSLLYVKVVCRGDRGWLKIDDFDDERALEVNFVDIGQGDGCHIVTPDDEVLLIDAGEADNMNRFLSWRYNLRDRNVRRSSDFNPDLQEDDPWEIDCVVMSHPDLDHYGGFQYVFANPKLSFNKVYHNGIVERPKEKAVSGVEYPDKWDLGGQFDYNNMTYLYDYVTGSTALKDIVNAHPKSQKVLMRTYRALLVNSKNVTIKGVGINMTSLKTKKYLPSFDNTREFSLQILGPIREKVRFKRKDMLTVRRLGSEGETKNGHSVIFQAKYKNLKLFLGGDLNTMSQNFLMQAYSGSDYSPEEMVKMIKKLKKRKQPLPKKDDQLLKDLEAELSRVESVGRKIFESDVAKACHHGSQHVTDYFIRAVNSIATVISSGDGESHSHPRPDALGAYGRYGRGERPLIFSTELARSTHEFTPQLKSYLALRGITLQIEAEKDKKEKKKLLATLQKKQDRNVAVYGMITLRAKGGSVIIAQKLEEARSESQKWDIYELNYDEAVGGFVYDSH